MCVVNTVDSVARVWDMRTKHQIHVLTGHRATVGSILTNAVDPQIITSSYDSTIKVERRKDSGPSSLRMI